MKMLVLPDDRPDPELVASAAAGDEQAIATLVTRHETEAWRLACGLTADAAMAEDAVQEAFIRSLAGLGRLRSGVTFKTWLTQCVVWACRTQQRTARRWHRAATAAGPPAPLQPDVDLRLDVLAMLRGLPLRDREVLVLRYYVGLPESDAAQLLGCRIGTIKSRLARARERMGSLATTAEDSFTDVDCSGVRHAAASD